MKKEMQIVGTASKKYRLYSEDGTVLGTFDKMSEAKHRMNQRAQYMKTHEKR